MILVFCTVNGLTNQINDIISGISFCLINNYKFTFKNCQFRNKDLVSFYYEDFEKLFNISKLIKDLHILKNLYIDYNSIELNKSNTFNIDNVWSSYLFNNNFEEEIKKIDKTYIILPYFHTISKMENIVEITNKILPSSKIINLYDNIKNSLFSDNQKYNCIHYRYEQDFIDHFKVKIEPFKTLFLRIKNKFKDKSLKIYIACYNLKYIININDNIYNLIVIKDNYELEDVNYEELAYIDYLFAKNSEEFYGHSKSAFSVSLNNLKKTKNYYDI
uniref:GDP-fucose protein O-fucosyltransferase n=1 Tax=viral metagenome TaxID=1070528 RepID=A0A6C0H180_9ZZZZ